MDDLVIPFEEFDRPGIKRKIYALMYQGHPEAKLFFLNQLDKSAQGRYLATLERLATMAQPPPQWEKYHLLDRKKSKEDVTGLGELKDLTSKTRFMTLSHFYREPQEAGSELTESRIILLQGFQKKETDLDAGEIGRGILRRDYYLAQVNKRLQQVQKRIEASRKSSRKR